MFRSQVEVTQGSKALVGRRVAAPGDLSTFPPYTCYYSGMQGRRRGSGYSGLTIHQGKEERESVRRHWRQRDHGMIDISGISSVNHNSRVGIAAILNTQWASRAEGRRRGGGIRSMTRSTRKWESREPVGPETRWHKSVPSVPRLRWPRDLQANL